MNKKTIITILIGLIVIALGFLLWSNRAPEVAVEAVVPINLCFYSETQTPNGLKDVEWLKTTITGKNITGEYASTPAEKDSKSGPFTGTISSLNQATMSRTAETLWTAKGEGMSASEKLIFTINSESANIGHGEMVQDKNGVYVYKNKKDILYSGNLGSIACDDLSDKIAVESYIKTNIKTLAPSRPVMGGNWYITNVILDTTAKTGLMIYEDGHIQNKATFSYTRTGDTVIITKVKRQW